MGTIIPRIRFADRLGEPGVFSGVVPRSEGDLRVAPTIHLKMLEARITAAHLVAMAISAAPISGSSARPGKCIPPGEQRTPTATAVMAT
jgi:hypothetical protein